MIKYKYLGHAGYGTVEPWMRARARVLEDPSRITTPGGIKPAEKGQRVTARIRERGQRVTARIREKGHRAHCTAVMRPQGPLYGSNEATGPVLTLMRPQGQY